MNKAELVEALAVHFDGNKAEATRALNAVLQIIIYNTATEDSVTILGFGAFEKTNRPARVVHDPRTGERHWVKALATPRFRPGSEFKAYVSGAKKVPKPPRKKSAKTATRPSATGETQPPPAGSAPASTGTATVTAPAAPTPSADTAAQEAAEAKRKAEAEKKAAADNKAKAAAVKKRKAAAAAEAQRERRAE